MSETTTAPQVHCPKCNSTQVYASKKGFSGKKAVAGAVLTGGIGLLAGTIGSNKVKITCLNCGHIFQPGDKPKVLPAIKPTPSAPVIPADIDPLDREAIDIIKSKGLLKATKFYHEKSNLSLEESKERVISLQKTYQLQIGDPSGNVIVVICIIVIIVLLFKACS